MKEVNEVNELKREWLEESLFVDEFGRDYNLSDVPMTYMKRKKVLEKRGYSDEQIESMWRSYIFVEAQNEKR